FDAEREGGERGCGRSVVPVQPLLGLPAASYGNETGLQMVPVLDAFVLLSLCIGWYSVRRQSGHYYRDNKRCCIKFDSGSVRQEDIRLSPRAQIRLHGGATRDLGRASDSYLPHVQVRQPPQEISNR
ncbi:hypothetical protein F441_07535, partial [Phytophthora nicotianae CJ01A1]